MAQSKKAVELQFPRLPIKNWNILGLDLSLSRTGYAVHRLEDGVARWVEVGSFTPKDSSDETWARGLAIATLVRDVLFRLTESDPLTGIILSVEFPDPKNSYLMALNGIVQAALWSSGPEGTLQERCPIYRFAINAMTLRSVLRLNKTVEGNKDVNIAMAYNYIDQKEFPNLDSDNCDAVLLAMMGRHAAMVLGGHEDMVPIPPLQCLCTCEMKVKVTSRTDKKTGAVKAARKEKPKGLLHNPATWTRMGGPVQVRVASTDARLQLTRPPVSTVLL